MRHARRGFTLLELLIAIALMAIVAASLYSSLFIGMRTSRSAVAAIQPARMAALTLELMRQDFAAALPPKGILAGPFQGTSSANSSNFDELVYFSGANAPREGEVGCDIRKVDLLVETLPDDAQPALVRRITSNLLASQEPVVHEQVLCRGIKQLKFRFYDGTVWQESWDSTAVGDVLPAAVEVTIEFYRTDPKSDPAARTYRTTRTFMLHCSQPPPSATTGATPIQS